MKERDCVQVATLDPEDVWMVDEIDRFLLAVKSK